MQKVCDLAINETEADSLIWYLSEARYQSPGLVDSILARFRLMTDDVYSPLLFSMMYFLRVQSSLQQTDELVTTLVREMKLHSLGMPYCYTAALTLLRLNLADVVLNQMATDYRNQCGP